MTKRNEVYQCELCGNITSVDHASGGKLVCCNQPMTKLEENTTDAAQEKHVPVVEKIDGGYKVTVGEVNHPMGSDHFIEWIELIAGNEVYKKYLEVDEAPVAIFKTDATDVYARAYCNLHGFWKS